MKYILIFLISLFIYLVYNRNIELFKNNNINEQEFKKKLEILYKIALKNTSENLIEGNVYKSHHKNQLRKNCNKIKNLKVLAKNCKNYLEVGFNAGHSCFTILDSNPKIKNVLIFDINSHKYTEPTFNQVKKWNKSTNFNFIKGDSTRTIPLYNVDKKFDLIHIDGGHSFQIAKQDIINCKKFATNNHLLIIDDCNNKNTNKCLKGAVKYCIDNKIIKILDLPSDLEQGDHVLAKYI